jgi:hypothetical protein
MNVFGRDPNDRASGWLCPEHFENRNTTVAQQYYCVNCQSAKRSAEERIQREHTIDSGQPYGVHIRLTCRNHPHLRWSTKNIDYIGARSIFYTGRDIVECSCPVSDLIVVKENSNA